MKVAPSVEEARRAWENGSPWSIQTVPPRMVRSSNVDHVCWSSVRVVGRDGDEESDVAEVEGPAAGEEPEHDVIAWK